MLNENFDRLVVYNTEQTTGNLYIESKPKTMLTPFPIITNNHIKVECAKVEQKYRINYIVDRVKDRNSEQPLFEVEANGYRKVINRLAVDYGKTQLKPLRHNFCSLILTKTNPADNWMTFKWNTEKNIISPR